MLAVIMMKTVRWMWIGILVIALLGCTQPPEEKIPQVPTSVASVGNLSLEESMETIQSGDVTVLKIRAHKTENGWQFPLTHYDKPLIDADLHGEAFIRLNSTHIPWLENNELIWLTPMLWNGSGMLFNEKRFNRVMRIKSMCLEENTAYLRLGTEKVWRETISGRCGS